MQLPMAQQEGPPSVALPEWSVAWYVGVRTGPLSMALPGRQLVAQLVAQLALWLEHSMKSPAAPSGITCSAA